MERRLLNIYLADHLSAAEAICARARASARANRRTEFQMPLEAFARGAADDRDELVAIIRRLGLRRNRFKEIAALAAERAGRLKGNGRLLRYSPLSRLEELEALAAGASANASMWETLGILGEGEAGLDSASLSERYARARAQADALGELRREQARRTFS